MGLHLGIYMKRRVNLLSLAPLLHGCPLLQVFRLEMRDDTSYNGSQVQKPVEIHSELEKVEIVGFGATENEMEFALYIVKSAVGLEQMYVNRNSNYYTGGGGRAMLCSPRWGEDVHTTILERLKSEAASEMLQFIFSQDPPSDYKTDGNYGILGD